MWTIRIPRAEELLTDRVKEPVKKAANSLAVQ